MNSTEAQATLVSIIRDDLDACDERDRVFQFRSIPEMYDEIDWTWVWWWISTFVTDRDHRRRLAALIREPRLFFADLAKLHHLRTGQSMAIPKQLISALQRRLLHAAYPTLDEITAEAKRAPAERAARNLLHYIEVDQWRTKSLS